MFSSAKYVINRLSAKEFNLKSLCKFLLFSCQLCLVFNNAWGHTCTIIRGAANHLAQKTKLFEMQFLNPMALNLVH